MSPQDYNILYYTDSQYYRGGAYAYMQVYVYIYIYINTTSVYSVPSLQLGGASN